jgi:leucyl-tRNA---protein transferase
MQDAKSKVQDGDQTVRVFVTNEHDCGYFADRVVQNLVIDPDASNKQQIYDKAIQHGYRRAGESIFKPKCPQCSACIATRIRISAFEYSRAQRRCLKRNQDLICEVRDARHCDEALDLYQRYLKARHLGAGMDDADADSFQSFLLGKWARTKFIQLRKDGQLLANAVTDFTEDGLSAMYTFFDPNHAERSLGVASILAQIQIARGLSLPFVYLGYWIDQHPKMQYKAGYSALEIYQNGRWSLCSPGLSD